MIEEWLNENVLCALAAVAGFLSKQSHRLSDSALKREGVPKEVSSQIVPEIAMQEVASGRSHS